MAEALIIIDVIFDRQAISPKNGKIRLLSCQFLHAQANDMQHKAPAFPCTIMMHQRFTALASDAAHAPLGKTNFAYLVDCPH